MFGSQPARDFMPNIEASYVIPLGGDVIVHPNADAPLEVGAGEVHRVDGFPRIHSNQAGLTIVLVVKGFGPIDRKRALLARASRHPLIRVDVPVDIASSLAVYGVSEPQVYATLLQRAYEEVRNSATSDELTWTWLLGAALDPVPDPRPLPLRQVRGRFPGGVGVVELVNDRVAFVAGGQLMVCELADVERLVPFVAHEVVDVSQPELLLTADLLVRFGLAAPVEA